MDGGYAYTDKAYDLVEHGIRRGHNIRRPIKKPNRQILTVLTNDDITEIMNKK